VNLLTSIIERASSGSSAVSGSLADGAVGAALVPLTIERLITGVNAVGVRVARERIVTLLGRRVASSLAGDRRSILGTAIGVVGTIVAGEIGLTVSTFGEGIGSTASSTIGIVGTSVDANSGDRIADELTAFLSAVIGSASGAGKHVGSGGGSTVFAGSVGFAVSTSSTSAVSVIEAILATTGVDVTHRLIFFVETNYRCRGTIVGSAVGTGGTSSAFSVGHAVKSGGAIGVSKTGLQVDTLSGVSVARGLVRLLSTIDSSSTIVVGLARFTRTIGHTVSSSGGGESGSGTSTVLHALNGIYVAIGVRTALAAIMTSRVADRLERIGNSAESVASYTAEEARDTSSLPVDSSSIFEDIDVEAASRTTFQGSSNIQVNGYSAPNIGSSSCNRSRSNTGIVKEIDVGTDGSSFWPGSAGSSRINVSTVDGSLGSS